MNNKKLKIGVFILVLVFITLSAYQIYYVAHLSTTLNLDYGSEVTFEDIKDRLDVEMDQLWLVDIAQVVFGSLVVLALYMRGRFLELEINLYKSFEEVVKEKVKPVFTSQSNEESCRIQDVEKIKETLTTLKPDYNGIVDYLCMVSRASSAIIYELENNVLNPVGSYATVKKYSFYSSYRLGIGVVGEVARSLKPIVINDVDTSELMVSSGLGNALPNQLIALPLFFDHQLVGVVEFSYLERLTKREEQLLQQLCVINESEI